MAEDFIARPVAAPYLSMPTPWDSTAVLAALHKQVQEAWVTLGVISPVFAKQLDRSLQAAIQASMAGNGVALMAEFKDIRRQLHSVHASLEANDDQDNGARRDKKENPQVWLIDKLAARVLDFDLKYIEKKMESAAH